MFLLVAFFMVVSITMVLQEGIPVNLSQAEMGESAADSSESITLSVTADGTFYLQKEPLDIDSLLDSLSTLASTAPKTSVTINADRETSHGNVVLALDTVRRAGLSNVVIAVEPGR
jgi:biopolymer transport protein ExbD